MSEDRDIGYVLLGFGMGVWWFFNGFRIFRKKQLIDNIPTSTVRGMAMGLVELNGQAGRESFLQGPFSNDDCVMYDYHIERYQRRGKSSQWVTIARGNSFCLPFYVEDATGRVMVDPRGVEFISDNKYSYTTGWGNPLAPNLISFMTKNGISYSGFLGDYTLRFTERNIKPGESVYILGTTKKTVNILADAGEYKNKLVKRLNEIKSDPDFMAKVDTNKDGNISDKEWEKAVIKIEHDLLQNEIAGASVAAPLDIVIGKGDEEKTFIVSDKSQKDLDASLGWQCAGGIFGGAALAVFCLGYLLMRFHIF